LKSSKKRLKIRLRRCGEKMSEDAYKILDYLPYSYKTKQEQVYIEFLWDSFESNYKNQKFQFALIPFHMLFMSAVYFDIWKIKINNQNDFEKALIGLRKEDEKIMSEASWPFTFSKINESHIFRFLKLINFDNCKIGNFCKVVDDRNSVAHSNGNIFVQAQESLDSKISEILRCIEDIAEHSKHLIKNIFQNFLLENWNVDERENLDDKEQIRQLLIQRSYFNSKDIKFCLNFDIRTLQEKQHYAEMSSLFDSFKSSYADA